MIKKVSRVEFNRLTFDDSDAKKNPFDQFRAWWNEAIAAKVGLIDAVHLSTVDENNHPDARIVLLKSFDNEGFVFYTNYHSEKSRQLAHNPHASLMVFWPKVERQIRIRGQVFKTPVKESNDYFKTRPRGAQLGAWASSQSEVIENRAVLEHAFAHYAKKFEREEVPRPPHWGGFCLAPHYFEFWQGRSNRLHDRICFTKNKDQWEIHRLAP
jgi:pyridoxamine 5'-phosphate oxidase